ncbi:MAG: SDR family oxidoreductase [Alphaproteobacteria bacterium]|nr:SDR family oxidoreductase [Alphaproteobacteria bacterium]
MAGELNGKVAVVSGAGRGIGRAAAEALAKAGAAVTLTARTASEGEAAAEALKASGGRALFIQADVAKEADWIRVMDQTQAAFGRVDILVANAGVSFPKNAVDMTLAEFRQMTDINLKGVFFGAKHALTAMRKHGQGGSMILVSSIVSKVGPPGYTHYAAAKGGVTMLAKSLALELGAEAIRVNSLHPGLIRTAMTDPFPEKALAPMIPLKRFGLPEEMASAILFLASDRSKFMTGAELVADGGFTVQ